MRSPPKCASPRAGMAAGTALPARQAACTPCSAALPRSRLRQNVSRLRSTPAAICPISSWWISDRLSRCWSSWMSWRRMVRSMKHAKPRPDYVRSSCWRNTAAVLRRSGVPPGVWFRFRTGSAVAFCPNGSLFSTESGPDENCA